MRLTRRHLLAGSASLALAQNSAPPLIRPAALRPGDTVGLITPATYVSDPDRLALAERTLRFFDLNYHRGAQWYRGHFPVTEIARLRTGRHGPPAAFEASGYYLYHPQAAERLGHDMPTVKLVVMLRDPVERAFSAHKHEFARGYEQEDFPRALELEDDRLAGEVERIAADPAYESFAHRHHSYRHRGQYAEQLERFYEFFPRTQVHVIDSAAYFSQPAQEYQRLLAFLDLRSFEPAFAPANSRPGPPMDAGCRRMLQEHYQPHDERLAKLLGRQPGWVR